MSLFFSIVIPTYNRAAILSETLHSSLNQTYQNYEVIVVDDGSTDNTSEIVRNFIDGFPGHKIFYYKKSNGERAAARNFGTQHAAGDYVCFFDSDDLMYPNHLSTANEFLLRHERPELCHLNYDIKDHSGKVMRHGPHYSYPPNKQLMKGNFLSCDGVFVRKDIAINFPFNEDRQLSAAEDWELWLRLAARFPIYYCNAITSSIINHSERSVLETNAFKLIKRMELLLQYSRADSEVARAFGSQFTQLQSSVLSYISLHMALMTNENKTSRQYLSKTLRIDPLFIFKRRFFAILKHLM